MIVLPSQLWVLRSLLEALLGSCCFPNKKGHTQLAWLLLFLCVPALKADNFCSCNSHLRPWGTKQENESQYADSRMERYKEPQSPMAQLPPYFLEITSRPSFTWKKKIKLSLFKPSGKCNPDTFHFDNSTSIFPWGVTLFPVTLIVWETLPPFLSCKNRHLYQTVYWILAKWLIQGQICDPSQINETQFLKLMQKGWFFPHRSY